jgi:hypothetical protein
MKYIKVITLILILIITAVAIKPVYAQSIPQNLSNINVNDISDSQLQQLLLQAQAAGLSDQQIIQQAQNRGLPSDQVQVLQKRISDLRKKGGTAGNTPDTSYQTFQPSRKLNYRPETVTLNLNRTSKLLHR